jgi:hypothetical protein
MTPAIIAQLILTLGPTALELIPKLAAVWHKESLTLEEVNSLCAVSQTPYEKYMADARAALGK